MVENPELVKAMDKLATDKSRQTKLKLAVELNRANYLVPVKMDKMNASDTNKDGVVNLEKDSGIEVVAMSDGKGNDYMPVFTDIKSFESWASDDMKTIVLPADKVWKFVLSKSQYYGVVVNPGAKALPLKKKAIQFLASRNE